MPSQPMSDDEVTRQRLKLQDKYTQKLKEIQNANGQDDEDEDEDAKGKVKYPPPPVNPMEGRRR